MRPHPILIAGALAVFALFAPSTGRAQPHPAHASAADTSGHGPGHMGDHDMAGMDMSGMDMHDMHASMQGLYGAYPMAREASGTAWQPDASEHRGLHAERGAWMLMLHGNADAVFDHQGGPRGDDQWFSGNMLMGMARRAWGPATLGLRGMVSAEPATIGREGYPLLLQTGETANGRDLLIDRQHPHDLFMELAASFSVARGDRSLFVYGGLPGEPALGPPAFMHRFSGRDIPTAPITHHWLDSTHITYGVLTAGAVVDRIKVEASAFRGREPDERRWNIESPRLDSHAFRLSVNPTANWSLQVSQGRLHSPEQLEPDVDQDRTTASAIHAGLWPGGHWETTLAWGRDHNRPGHTLDAFALEAAATVHERHTLFARAERVEKDELLSAPDPRAGQVFDVSAVSAGYRIDRAWSEHCTAGVGALGTLTVVPATLRSTYGRTPGSVLVFLRFALH